MSGPVEGTSRRLARAASLPLQFREAPSRIEIWTGNQDAGSTGWPDPQAADFERSLLIETAFWVVEQCPIHTLLLGSAGHPYHSRNGSGRLATLDDGSTEWRISQSLTTVFLHTTGSQLHSLRYDSESNSRMLLDVKRLALLPWNCHFPVHRPRFH